ncbi:MAG TPA: hypothetical protein VI078_00935, partial [bacterium]
RRLAFALAGCARGIAAKEAAGCRRALRAVNIYLVLVLLLAVLAGVHAAAGTPPVSLVGKGGIGDAR